MKKNQLKHNTEINRVCDLLRNNNLTSILSELHPLCSRHCRIFEIDDINLRSCLIKSFDNYVNKYKIILFMLFIANQ